MMTQLRWLVVGVLLAVSVGSLVAFGVLGKGRGGGSQNFDGAVMYAAGRAWLNGRNPYLHTDLSSSVADEPTIQLEGIYFFYPPQTCPLCLTLAPFPYAVARPLWLLINLVSIAALAWMAAIVVRSSPGGHADYVGMAVLGALIIGNFFTTHVIWMGQTSLVATAFAMASWLCQQRRRWLLAGIFFALASFKPQLCVLLGVWYLLERDWKTLLAATIAGLVLCIHPMLVHGGPVGMLQAWKGDIDGYKSLNVNQPGDPHKVGFESLLAAGGLELPGLLFTAAGVALTGIVWLYRQRLHPADVLGILMGITFLFVGYSHDYDYVGLVPLWVALWLVCRERPAVALAVVPLLVLLFVPQQLVRKLVDQLLVLHWRTVVVLMLTLVVLRFSGLRADERATSPAV